MNAAAGSEHGVVIAALRRGGLIPAQGEPRLVALAGGVSCDVWLVEAGEQRLVAKRALAQLRVAAEWRAPVERAENEVRWLRRVAAIAPRLVPEVLGADPAAHLFAMRYLDAADHPVWRDELIAGRIDVDFAAAVARDLAAIHAATAGHAADEAAFATGALFEALRIGPFLRHVAERRREQAPRLLALAYDLSTRRVALVHGDVSPKNILAGPDGPVFLDAECAVYGDPAFDIAFCLTHLLLKQVWLAPHAAALRASAEAMAAAYLSGVSWEAPETVSARAAALVAALLLARVEGKSPAAYLPAAARDRVRRKALALLTGPPDTLEQLIADWAREPS